LQKFARRIKNKSLDEEEIRLFNVQLWLQFSVLQNPLTYQSLKDRILLIFFPMTSDEIKGPHISCEEFLHFCDLLEEKKGRENEG